MSGFQIGKIAGIPIRLNISLLVLIGIIFWVSAAQSGLSAAINSVIVLVGIFVSIALHELAHSFVTLDLGIRVKGITLFIFGGMAQLERMPTKAYQEILISVVGPPVNFGIAGIIILARLYLVGPLPQDLGNEVWMTIAAANITIGAFNCIPAFPMDGGRVLRALLWLATDFLAATRIVNVVSKVLLIFIGGLMWWLQGPGAWPMLLVLAFLWILGSAETRMAEARAVMQRIPVTHATVTRCPLLSPHDPVAAGMHYLRAGYPFDQPVIEAGRLVGLLRRSVLTAPDGPLDPQTTVQQVMDADFLWFDGAETVATVEERLAQDEASGAAVFVDRQLLGIVSRESISACMAAVLRGAPGGA